MPPVCETPVCKHLTVLMERNLWITKILGRSFKDKRILLHSAILKEGVWSVSQDDQRPRKAGESLVRNQKGCRNTDPVITKENNRVQLRTKWWEATL